MEDSPKAAELVLAVREFMETRLMPTLEGHTAFHARVAINALAIVERQLDQGGTAEASEHQRLSDLLGRENNLEALNRALCQAIRGGQIALDHPGLKTHLRLTTIDKVMIDQPHYSGLRQALS